MSLILPLLSAIVLTVAVWVLQVRFDPFLTLGRGEDTFSSALLMAPIPDLAILLISMTLVFIVHRKQRCHLNLHLSLVLAANILLIVIPTPYLPQPPVYRFLQGFAAKTLESGDLPILESWAAKEFGKSNDEIPPRDLPAFAFLKPNYAHAQNSGRVGGRPTIDLVFGGGFGHWGIITADTPFSVSTDGDFHYIQLTPKSAAWYSRH